MGVSEMIEKARNRVEGLSVDEVAAEREHPDVVLVDVREPAEIEGEGIIPGALAAPRGMLEFHADATTPYHLSQFDPDARMIVYCKSGSRSALAAATLQDMGYGRVAHLEGGINAWKDSRRPVEAV